MYIKTKNMKKGSKIALIVVGSVVISAVSTILFPMPYSAIMAGLIGVSGGLWIRKFSLL
jgi:protein-S-isoprenylcysteine O-methyltransferase Ste14